MLKSYKQLSRWYGALEPEAASEPAAPPGDTGAVVADRGDVAAPGENRLLGTVAPPAATPSLPADLSAQRSEFSGGWSDWVVTGRAPGPDDDDVIPARTGVAQFPWSDEPDSAARSRSGPTLSAQHDVGERRASRRGRVFIVAVTAVAALVAVSVCAAVAVRTLAGRAVEAENISRPLSASMQFTAGTVQAGAHPLVGGARACPTENGGDVVRSAEAGGTESGPDAVLHFQYAYYVDRSGERARAAVAPDAAVQPAQIIQRGIDAVPVGTTHCVRIVTIDEGRYSVEVTEYRPGRTPATYNKQMVTTAVIHGRTLITGIAAR
ncbi:hypothetical protein [Nocardia sp. CNY236]|uniref:hypothetical protein n=1 Tax=Nocardia sp. CNY236 TaxID=1169152 RepID=UPI000418317A|nr:hypothetical protein [Nocardia sp. CNY236]